MELKKIKNIRAKFSKLPEKKIIKKSVLKPVQWKWQLSYPLHCQRRAFHHPGCDSSPAARSYTSKSPAASMGWQSTRWRIARGSQQTLPSTAWTGTRSGSWGSFSPPWHFSLSVVACYLCCTYWSDCVKYGFSGRQIFVSTFYKFSNGNSCFNFHVSHFKSKTGLLLSDIS